MELTRRAFLEGVLGVELAAAALLAQGCGRPAARDPFAHIEGELLGQSAAGGHLLRGDLRARTAHVATLPETRVGVAIVGGGPSGLSAAYALARAGRNDFVLLELEPELGGTARGGASPVTAFPWGAHYLPTPHRHNLALVTLLRELGVIVGEDERGEFVISEPHLVRAPEERLFYKGYWYPGLYLEAGATAADLAERARFDRLVAHWVSYRDPAGRRAFTIPLRLASDAPELRALDALPATAYLAQHGIRSRRLLWLLDYACRDDYGLRLADTSAWALLFYFASRIERPGAEPSELITWPEGNSALVRQLAKSAHGRVRTSMLVLDVHQQGEQVELLAWDLAREEGVRYVAERALLATPQFVTQRIVRALREQGPSATAPYAPWLVANLHLRQRPSARGAQLAWDNILYDSPSLGYVCATHQRGSDHGESVFTYYLPLADRDARKARQQLYDGDYAAWRSLVLLDLTRAHPELPELVTRLDVFRWGHAMVRPEVGRTFAPELLRARSPLGRLHFAHSELSGVSLFEEAFDQGIRAAGELAALLPAAGRP